MAATASEAAVMIMLMTGNREGFLRGSFWGFGGSRFRDGGGGGGVTGLPEVEEGTGVPQAVQNLLSSGRGALHCLPKTGFDHGVFLRHSHPETDCRCNASGFSVPSMLYKQRPGPGLQGSPAGLEADHSEVRDPSMELKKGDNLGFGSLGNCHIPGVRKWTDPGEASGIEHPVPTEDSDRTLTDEAERDQAAS